jgi:catechol 2,3-dioxygenase-like lactoylglutathione lyase family enzyme
MKIRGTDFVMYQVSDLARAAKFYRETLGLPQETYSEEWKWAEFNCGNVILALNSGVQLPDVIAGGRMALAVDDVFAACAELKAEGVRFTLEPTDYSVCRAATILDPDGNLVILHQRADGTFGPHSQTEAEVAKIIIAMERAALDRWGQGDPSGFLEICAPDVVYFDNTLEQRLDGLGALTAFYEKLRGQIYLDRYELLNPKVQLCDAAAVFTCNFVGYAEEKVHRWNCTEVYRRTPDGWRIIQTHWSLTKPAQH